MKEQKPYFPMFIDISGKKILIVGGGAVAARRTESLLMFNENITVVAPELCKTMDIYRKSGKIDWISREWVERDLEGNDIVLAATGQREINALIGQKCNEMNIMVNVADDRNMCDFFFPSIIKKDEIIIGIGSNGENPGNTRRMRENLEEYLK